MREKGVRCRQSRSELFQFADKQRRRVTLFSILNVPSTRRRFAGCAALRLPIQILRVRQKNGDPIGLGFTIMLADFHQPLDVVGVKQHRAQQVFAA